MASMFVLVVVIAVAWAIITVGATAYELTGLDREAAKFQALSAFTGTGFTTRISELVVRHPTRRRITSVLIILGYGGTATVVASLLASFAEASTLQAVENVLVFGVLASIAYWAGNRWGTAASDAFRRFLTPRLTGEAVPHEELLLYKRGYGITRIEVPADSRVVGKRLRDLDLRSSHIQIIAVEEYNDVHPIPNPDWRFEAGHHLIVYGRIAEVQDAFGPPNAAD